MKNYDFTMNIAMLFFKIHIVDKIYLASITFQLTATVRLSDT